LAVALDEPEKEKKSKSPFDISGINTKQGKIILTLSMYNIYANKSSSLN